MITPLRQAAAASESLSCIADNQNVSYKRVKEMCLCEWGSRRQQSATQDNGHAC